VLLLDPRPDHGPRPVPAGVPGELCLGGGGLTRGYLGRPDLTAGRFVPDPFGPPGSRLYRTGDLARWLPDGRLDLLGRIDDQVKIRGFRVEPGEIEAVLESCPGVRQAAVVVRDLPSGERSLAGCLAGVAGEGPDPRSLRALLIQQLPAHMVPAELIVLDDLPLSPNGKVDREALKRRLAGRPAEPRGATPPADGIERSLAAIWEELLGVTGVGREEGFFDLGGHSLLAVRLVARVERELGRRLPLTALFRGATLAAMAAEIRSAPAAPAAMDGPASPLVPLREGGAGRPFFWFHALDGRTLCYADLVRHLPVRPLYGLEDTGSGAASLEDLAARYAGAIAAAQPGGPCLLGGWSFGGLVAWETARRLEGMGREVGLLALLDSRPPDPGAAVPDLGGALGGTVPNADLRAAVHARLEALRSYRPGPLAGPVVLFLAGDHPREEAAGLAALWRPLAPGGLAVETLPGDHFSLLREPAVAVLADKIRRRWARLDLPEDELTEGASYGGESP